MTSVSYDTAPAPVRREIADAHTRLWERLARPGAWFTGAERVAIAAEARAADYCAFCRQRKAALSPYAVQGEHESAGRLSHAVVEVVHRLRTDPGRLSRRYFDEALAGGLTDAAYVEVVGIVAQLTNVDSFCRALGVSPQPLPEPQPGEPSRRRPEGAKPAGAWVPMIAPSDARGPEADLYPRMPQVPNVARALSLVPDEARGIADLVAAQYLPLHEIMNLSAERTLTRPQMELVAGRISALNQCFY